MFKLIIRLSRKQLFPIIERKLETTFGRKAERLQYLAPIDAKAKIGEAVGASSGKLKLLHF